MLEQPTETDILSQIEQIKRTLRSIDIQEKGFLNPLEAQALKDQRRTLNDSWNRLNHQHESFYGNW